MNLKLVLTLTIAFLALGKVENFKLLQQEPKAALIIGGYSSELESTLDSVELFGCNPGSGTNSQFVTPYPVEGYLTSAIYVKETNSVIACGGNVVTEDSTRLTNACYELDSDFNWHEHSHLNKTSYAHFMDLIPDDSDPTKNVLRKFGYHYESETYDENSGTWSLDITFNTRTYSMGCMVEYKGYYYYIDTTVIRIDPATGLGEEMAVVPFEFDKPGHCARVNYNGFEGIINAYGHFMDLDTYSWSNLAPSFDDYIYPNVWSYQGFPTNFGVGSECITNSTCNYNNDVVQFDPTTNTWNYIGQVLLSRRFQTFVEVPASFCDNV